MKSLTMVHHSFDVRLHHFFLTLIQSMQGKNCLERILTGLMTKQVKVKVRKANYVKTCCECIFNQHSMLSLWCICQKRNFVIYSVTLTASGKVLLMLFKFYLFLFFLSCQTSSMWLERMVWTERWRKWTYVGHPSGHSLLIDSICPDKYLYLHPLDQIHSFLLDVGNFWPLIIML